MHVQKLSHKSAARKIERISVESEIRKLLKDKILKTKSEPKELRAW